MNIFKSRRFLLLIKKKAELKVQKEQEIKDSWIKNKKKYEKKLDTFFDFLKKYPNDWIDIDELIKELAKDKETEERIQDLQTTIATYGLEIILDGYKEFHEKYDLKMVYLNLKNRLTEIWDKSKAIKEAWNILEGKVNEFNGRGFDDFEDKAMNLFKHEIENTMGLKKESELLYDFIENTKNSSEKNIVVERLGKEGRYLVGSNDKSGEIIDKYNKKKKIIDPNREPKKINLR